MRIAYTAPAYDEIYLVDRKSAVRIARSSCPDLDLLAFQTRRGPNMSPDIPYLASFSGFFVRILSIRPEFFSPTLASAFRDSVLPSICATACRWKRKPYGWPWVVIAKDGAVHQVCCSEGGRFPDIDEITASIKRHPHSLCRYRLAMDGQMK